MSEDFLNYRVADGIIINTSGHSPQDIMDFQMELEINEIHYIRNDNEICILKLESTRFHDRFEDNIERIEIAKAFWFDICERSGIPLSMFWREFYVGGNGKSYRSKIVTDEEE